MYGLLVSLVLNEYKPTVILKYYMYLNYISCIKFPTCSYLIKCGRRISLIIFIGYAQCRKNGKLNN